MFQVLSQEDLEQRTERASEHKWKMEELDRKTALLVRQGKQEQRARRSTRGTNSLSSSEESSSQSQNLSISSLGSFEAAYSEDRDYAPSQVEEEDESFEDEEEEKYMQRQTFKRLRPRSRHGANKVLQRGDGDTIRSNNYNNQHDGRSGVSGHSDASLVWSVEYATSGRSKCSKDSCGQLIPNKAVRFKGVSQGRVSFFHLTCLAPKSSEGRLLRSSQLAGIHNLSVEDSCVLKALLD